MTLRLDTYPEAQIATHMHPQSAAPTPTLCCLLHTGTVPASHQIQVWVGGKQQTSELEGTQQVFSWQCSQGSEMSIHLMNQHRLMKAWRGWWQGETTIAHTGTLAVQVFCAGVPQPTGLTSPPAPVPSHVTPVVADQHNGSHPQAMPTVLAWPALLDTPPASLSATEAEPEDDLWHNPPQEAHSRAIPTLEEDGWEDTECEEEMIEEESWEDAKPAGGPDGPAEAGLLSETTDASATLPQISAPAGTTIATLPANAVWSQTAHQEAEARLTTLLSTMPPSTILVDLRQHSPTPRARRVAATSGPQKLGLSKELLRTRYGGRYWDRGSVIQTSRRLESTHPPRWGRVVINPDDREGLGALVTVLAQGFSLVILDGETSYAESARAAVLSELRQRVANLNEGSCS